MTVVAEVIGFILFPLEDVLIDAVVRFILKTNLCLEHAVKLEVRKYFLNPGNNRVRHGDILVNAVESLLGILILFELQFFLRLQKSTIVPWSHVIILIMIVIGLIIFGDILIFA